MLVTKGTREGAIHALINFWLKDPTLRCGWCGARYYKDKPPCCEQPYIGTNAAVMKQFYEDQKVIRETRKNSYASMKGRGTKNIMRWKLSFPPGLLRFLEVSFLRLYNEKLFTDKHNHTWFAKKFGKYFQVPEKL